jgi:hypothetical protein
VRRDAGGPISNHFEGAKGSSISKKSITFLVHKPGVLVREGGALIETPSHIKHANIPEDPMLSRAVAGCLTSSFARAGVAGTLLATTVARFATIATINASNTRAATHHDRVWKTNPDGEFAMWLPEISSPAPDQSL